jgi:hypothetical protein
VDLGYVISFSAVPHCDRVKAEDVRQNIHRWLVTDRDIYPDDSVLTFEQPWEFRNLMSLDTRIADEQDIHPFTTFHGARRASTRGRRGCRRNSGIPRARTRPSLMIFA